MTQPNPYPTEPPYIEQQLACRNKISLCTSCHHHHPNAHRNNANTLSISSINGQGINISDRWCSDAIFHKTNFPVDTRCRVIYTRHVFFAHLPFQTHDPTQPTKNTNFRPIPDPTQPNPTRGSTQPMDNSEPA